MKYSQYLISSQKLGLSISFILLSVLGFIYVLLINGLVPGVTMPTLGQAIWIGGFAESIVNNFPTVHAKDFGGPEPAAISFGLTGALTTSIFIAMGVNLADAYTLACLLWFSVAYIGAYYLGKKAGLSSKASIGMAVLWLILPVVWRHSGYSTLALGIALLPFYMNALLRFLEIFPKKIFKVTPFVIFVFFTSSFMDGYTYFMLVSFSTALICYDWLVLKQNRFLHYSIITACALFSFVAYSIYADAAEFPQSSMNFTRGFGADITFLVRPEFGSHWLWDVFGLSKKRIPANYFGDASVYWTSFCLIIFIIATYFLVSRHGDRKLKFLFFGIGFISLYLSLGPTIKINALRPDNVSALMTPEYGFMPSGTKILYNHIPGLKSMRASYRWIALALAAFWAVITIGLASKKIHRYTKTVIILALLVSHTPNVFVQYKITKSYRQQFFKLESDLAIDKSVFRKNDNVAFLPYGNDFLANHIWTIYDITTFNIGGDKNLFLAKNSWPEALKESGFMNFSNGDFERAAKLLLDKDVDTIAFSHIDMLSAAHAWPSPQVREDKIAEILAKFRASMVFNVQPGEYFTTVRLSVGDSGSNSDLKQAIADLCLPSLCIKNSMNESTIYTQVGDLSENVMRTTGRRGFLFFGPYAPLKQGQYQMTVIGQADNIGGAWLDIVADKGKIKIFRTTDFKIIEDGQVILSAIVDISEDVSDIEIRLYVTDTSELLVKSYTLLPI